MSLSYLELRTTQKLNPNLIPFHSLNVKAVLLVRDPRGTMNSRKYSVSFCNGHIDCDSTAVLCQNLVENHKASIELAKRFPGRFK